MCYAKVNIRNVKEWLASCLRVLRFQERDVHSLLNKGRAYTCFPECSNGGRTTPHATMRMTLHATMRMTLHATMRMTLHATMRMTLHVMLFTVWPNTMLKSATDDSQSSQSISCISVCLLSCLLCT